MNSTNSHSIEILRKYVDQSLSSSEKISFFILNWPKDIWKSQIVQDMAKEILWKYYLNDFLYIRDMSKFIWKDHILKVDSDESREDFKLMLKDHNYRDLGTRDILEWLYRSPSWQNKILLIENIERMNLASYNAFLKTCEEVLPNRIIIATTANKWKVLDTILSRAITINFYTNSYEELLTMCDQNWYFSDNKNLREFICFMSMWRINLLSEFNQILSENEELKNCFWGIVSTLSSDDIVKKYSLLMIIYNNWYLQQFMDGIISYYIQHDNFQEAQRWLNIKKMSQTNVSTEHLLFSGLL